MVTVYSNHDKKINKQFTVIMLQQDNFLNTNLHCLMGAIRYMPIAHGSVD